MTPKAHAEYSYGQPEERFPCGYSPGFSRYDSLVDDVSGGMRIYRAWFYRDAVDTADFRFSFYAGGAASYPFDPAGATLAYDSGLQQHTGSGWESFTLSTPVEITSGAFGMAIKSDGDGFGYDCILPWNSPPVDDIKMQYVNIDDSAADPSVPFVSPVVASLAIDTYHDNQTDMYPETFFYFDYYAIPLIDDVTYGESWLDTSPDITAVSNGQGSLWINGSGFESQDEFGVGTSHVWLTENDSWDTPGTKVEQSVGTWFDSTFGHEHLKITIDFGALTAGSTAYLWVENSDGQVNLSGVPLLLQNPDATAPEEVADTFNLAPSSGAYFYPVDFPTLRTTATQEFTDPESQIYACEYSLDNGTTWQSAELSGSFPDYTCTKERLVRFSDVPYVLINDGDVIALQMRAISSGGTSTPVTTLHYTADKLAPVPGGGLSVTPGNRECTISWDPAVDAGVGLRPTAAYCLTWDGGTCVGPESTSYTQTNLNDATYTYGLNVYDALNLDDSYDSTVECIIPWVYLEDATNPPFIKAGSNSTDVAVGTFSLRAKTLADSITSLEVECGGSCSNVGVTKVYRDDGTLANTYDPDDTLIATANLAAGKATFTDLDIPVTTTAQQYLIAYDLTGTPTTGASLGGHVSAATVRDYTVTVSDNREYSVSLDANLPSTTDNVPADWQSNEVTVTFTPTDDDAGVDPATGIYACLGDDCTPALLGSNNLTTNCGAGNACSYVVRYYSVDQADNVEEIKTAANTIRIDRIPPTDGSFTVWSGNFNVPMEWSGFSDEGSGLDPETTYIIRRRMGEAPPDCSNTWFDAYEGPDTAYTVEGPVAGMEHFFRLCAVDRVGNISPGVVGSAWTDDTCSKNVYCDSCHAWPPLDLPIDAPDPKDPETGATLGSHGPHAMLGDPDYNCLICHHIPDDEFLRHVDGVIRIREPLEGGGSYDTGNFMGDHWEIIQEPFRPTGSCWDTSATSCHGAGASPQW